MKYAIQYASLFLLLSAYPTAFASAQADNILIQKDVPFVPGGGADQQMDLYLPGRQGFPLILFLHEGSLTSGDKKDHPYEAIGKNFAHAGIGFIVANYRLGPKHKWPAMIEDCAVAFAWITTNAEILRANPERLFIMGHSSGALIAALLSTDEKYLKKFGRSLSSITGCVAMGTMLNPSYDTDSIPKPRLDSLWKHLAQRGDYQSLFESPQMYRDADPSRHITRNAPPFLVLIAEAEQFQPPILEQSKRFALQMQAVNVSVTVEVLKDRKHMSAMREMADPNDPTLSRIQNFVRDH